MPSGVVFFSTKLMESHAITFYCYASFAKAQVVVGYAQLSRSDGITAKQSSNKRYPPTTAARCPRPGYSVLVSIHYHHSRSVHYHRELGERATGSVQRHMTLTLYTGD